jgi:hypothetical protein
MSDQCPPLRLPIHVETSCSTKSCDCKHDYNRHHHKDNCYPNCDINTAVSSQGTFQNNCCKEVEQTADIVIASLSNVRNNECQPDISVTLNTICLDWCDFLLLFYSANNTFNILPTASKACAINFAGQTYEDTTSQSLRLNLSQLVRQAWANKCETSINKIPSKTGILLNKETSYIRSLISANSSIALSLDQAINTLLNNGEIAAADSTSSATVVFIVEYVYYFKPLNVSVQINFVYKTKIPCYKNLNYCDNWCPPYSKEYNCRTCGELDNKSLDFTEIKNSFECDSQSDENNSHGDESQSHGDEFGSVGDLKDMSKFGHDEKTYISIDSSKW